MSDTAGVLLAAGAGTRFGRPKALVQFAGKPLVERGIDTLVAGGCAPVHVVLGAAAADVRRAADLSRAVVVDNRGWSSGLASSLRCGLESLPVSCDAAVVALADQPLAGAPVIRRLLAAAGRGAPAAAGAGVRAAVATYAGRRGNPVLLARSVWPAVIAAAHDDVGARAWLLQHPEDVVAAECGDLGEPADIDTPADLAALEAAYRRAMDIVLIPGLWLDGSSWDDVVPALQRAGHRTHPLTLPGMTAGADRSGITLRDHIDAVVAVIDSLESGVVVVGHSGGGPIAHAAADARPERVSRVVYVDSWPLGDGGVINAQLPADGGDVPLPDWSFFDAEDLVDLDDARRAAFRARAIPSPVQVARGPQRLSDERRYDVPATIIACEFTGAQLREWMAAGEENLHELAKLRTVDYLDLPTGHWPQFTKPAELAEAILASLPPGR